MFIGHYALAPVLASPNFAKQSGFKLWHGFLAVQLVDFVWAFFILFGIEKASVIDGFTQANALDLHFMPYTHSLLFSVFWAIFGGVLFKVLSASRSWKGAVLFGLLVLSHWVGDVIVHVPDMTFWPGSPKIGFGLWNIVAMSLPLELGLTLVGLAYYLKSTQPKSPKSKVWAIGFAALLIGLQLYATLGPAPKSINEVAISGLFVFTLLVFCAAHFEKTRFLTSRETLDPS